MALNRATEALLPTNRSQAGASVSGALGSFLNPIVFQAVNMIGWAAFSVVLIFGGTALFDALTPIDYRAEIRKGNIAAGLVVAAVILAISAVVVSLLVS